MSSDFSSDKESRRRLWITAIVVGGVFYYLQHNPRISTVEYYAPWAVTTETFASENTAARGAVFGLIALLGIGLALQAGVNPRISSLLSWLVVAFVGWCGLSVLWSDELRVTFIRLSVLLITCVGAFGVSRGLTRQQWLQLVMLLAGTYALIGVGTELVLGTFRPWSGDYRFAGTLHPNGQGTNLAAFCLAAYCQLRWGPPRRWRSWMLLAIGFAFLCLTKSRTACASFLIAVALIEWVATPSWKPVYAGLAAAWLICAVALPMVSLGVDLEDEFRQAVLMGRADESDQLSGRQPVWEALLPYARDRLWTGYGYESFWTQYHIEHVQSIVRWAVRDSHSAYLNLVLGVGVVGLLLYLAMLAAALFSAAAEFRLTLHPADVLAFGLVVQFLAAGLLEANATPPNLDILHVCTAVARLAFPAAAFQEVSSYAIRRHSQPSACLRHVPLWRAP